jgi:hypothetical protein
MNDKDNLVRTALSLLDSRDNDDLMRAAFLLLSSRNIATDWATLQKPYSALYDDCTRLMLDTAFVLELKAYLQKRMYIHRSVEMLLTHMAMAENSRWDQTPDWMQQVSKRGRYINRFVPTFLVINGPIGRFLRWKDSPVKSRLGEEYPILSAAHNFLDDKVFKALRNGFAHWSFDIDVSGGEPYLISYEDGKDVVAAKLHLLEAEAFHIIAFGLTEILDKVFFQGVQDGN